MTIFWNSDTSPWNWIFYQKRQRFWRRENAKRRSEKPVKKRKKRRLKSEKRRSEAGEHREDLIEDHASTKPTMTDMPTDISMVKLQWNVLPRRQTVQQYQQWVIQMSRKQQQRLIRAFQQHQQWVIRVLQQLLDRRVAAEAVPKPSSPDARASSTSPASSSTGSASWLFRRLSTRLPDRKSLSTRVAWRRRWDRPRRRCRKLLRRNPILKSKTKGDFQI